MSNVLKFHKKPNYLLGAITWGGIAVSVAAIGILIGRELRLRYKFNHRSPYDYYAHAGDKGPLDSYAVGI